jgi:iron(III) transport system permease protein
MVFPVVHLAVRALEADDPVGLVVSARVAHFAWETLRLAGAVTAASVALGVTVAWLVERTDLPARRMLGLASVLPLVVPSYIGALALVAAFGPVGLAVEMPWLIGFWGALIALTLSTFPYVLLTARAALALADPALEDAARALGDSQRTAFRRVVLPQVRPAAAAGGLLVFLYVLSDFGAVAIMRYDTLTRGIFLEYRSTFDRARPALLGVILVVMTLVAIVAEWWVRGRSAAPPPAVAGRRTPAPVALGRWRWPAAIGTATLVVAGVGVPVGVLGWWIVVGGSRSFAGSLLAKAATTSIGLSLAAAAVAVAMSVPVAVLAVRFRSRLSRGVETMATAGYALPGLVIGLALVYATARYVPVVYRTYALVVAAYVIRFFPEALGAVRTSLAQVDPALEDAARSLGRNRIMATATVTLPLIRTGLFAGAALVFLTAMKELPATLILRPAGADTLAVRVWTGASEGFYAQAAAPALLLVLASALVLWPLRTTAPAGGVTE